MAPRATDTPTLELVLKRNSVERLKREKSPLGMLEELPALIAAGYEQVPEEDIVRLKWWGLYHDKPKIGTFMLRIKTPGGILSPPQLRAVGEISNVHGRGSGELTTRQNIQLHYLELGALPDVFDRLHAAGLTSAGACGDTVRNITGCPVAGLAHDELFDPTPVLEQAAERFYGNPDYSDLPRKHKISITACADSCAAPEINCVGLVGAIKDGRNGFGVVVGGGLSSVPRIARDLGVWVSTDEAVEVLAAILDEWRDDLKYRVSRVKARLKFMIDDIGPEGMRERVEARLGRRLEDFTLPPAPPPGNHLGVHERYVGVPVHLGLVTGDQMVALADLGHEVRITRQQNLVLVTGDDVSAELERIGLPLDAGELRGNAIACTGEPHCNFSVTETKSRMDGLVQLLEDRFPRGRLDGLRLHLDGCPHACAHHWVGDLGFQGTTVRDEEGKRRQAYDVYLRGGLDRPAAIARPVFRRVPTEELDDAVVGLVRGWVDARGEGETFRSFCDRSSDDELAVLAGREAARVRGAD
ncbi:MAG TPA: nitrite/sulfite reductase [Gaiellaceae bacterium]|jgi:ferredoxin-nitrite reductase|nr:nitrite/sulfite reductase [Gaiellaceae bacterium]